jgi:hypothetical protein
VLRAAPRRFRFRPRRSTRSRRCAVCTPGRSHAAIATHTSPASRTRKISGCDVLKSARAERPGRLWSSMLRAAPRRFGFRSDRSACSRRYAARTPGCPHAAAPTSSHLARFADEENQGRGIAEICSARRPGRLLPSVQRAARERFRFRSNRSARSHRCVICTPGRSHAAAPSRPSTHAQTAEMLMSSHAATCVREPRCLAQLGH